MEAPEYEVKHMSVVLGAVLSARAILQSRQKGSTKNDSRNGFRVADMGFTRHQGAGAYAASAVFSSALSKVIL